MITKELVDFIKKEKSFGKTDDQIKVELTPAGWTLQDIEEAFKQINSIQNEPFVPIKSKTDYSISPTSSVQPIANTISVKSHKGLLMFLIILFFLFACGVSAYYFQDDLKRLPIVKNFFPQTSVESIDNQVVPENMLAIPDIIPAVSVSNMNTICLAEVKARYSKFDLSKNKVVMGRVELTNPNFPFSSLEVTSGLFDKAKVKPDGTFCIAAKKAVSGVGNDIFFVSLNSKEILLGIFPAISTGNIVVNSESTALFSAMLSSAQFDKILDNSVENFDRFVGLIKTLPEGQEYIQSVGLTINNAKVGFGYYDLLKDASLLKKIEALEIAINKDPFFRDIEIKTVLDDFYFDSKIFYYRNYDSYSGFCSSQFFKSAKESFGGIPTFTCRESKTSWAASAQLSNKYWCIDSTINTTKKDNVVYVGKITNMAISGTTCPN